MAIVTLVSQTKWGKKSSHKQTHQLVDAVNGPVVLVTESLHALKALSTTRNKLQSDKFLLKAKKGHVKNYINYDICLKKREHFQLWAFYSPLGVIVNKHVVLHCQFKVWDLLTHPPWVRWDHTLIRCLCGKWELPDRKGNKPDGLDDFMSSIVMFILKTEKGKETNP